MSSKRARRHFSQLSEFERGLIIGMQTASWSTRRVAGQVDRLECAVRNCWEQWTLEGSHVRKTGPRATRHLAEANLKSKCRFRALPLTPEHRQLRLQRCQARLMWNVTDWQKIVFSDESRIFPKWSPRSDFQQDKARPHTVAQDSVRHFQTLPWAAHSPDLFLLEHVFNQLKRQMPSCHSVQDLELAVQDL
ncbi:uncharacterized protein TNCV_4285301 [Trichonephila clavipes]|nr:uncharacterized protein TNCV_4285301 [Trichonephila clavipes]